MAVRSIPFVANQPDRTNHQADHPETVVMALLIGDNSLLWSELQTILQGTPFVVAGAASCTGPERLQQLALQPALVIIDASPGTQRVLEVIQQVRERSPETRIVALADQFDFGFVRLGYEAGVDGFCSAATAPDVLIKRLELVVLGETVLPVQVLRSIVDEAPQNKEQPFEDAMAEPKVSGLMTHKLSIRETEILNCLRQGAPNKIIARKFDITEATIKVHVKAILRKIGAANRTQAAMWASQRLPRKGVSDLNV